MTGGTRVADFVRPYAEPHAVRVVSGGLARGELTLEVETGDGRLIVRAIAGDEPAHPSRVGCAVPGNAQWVATRAQTLRTLEAMGYEAPRLVRTRAGEFVSRRGNWRCYGATWVPGTAVGPDDRQLVLAGEALGRLHALPFDPRRYPETGRSHWHPAAAVPAVARWLAQTAPLIPDAWRELHDAGQECVQQVRTRLPDLRETLTHGDAWPGNWIQTAAGRIALIDWEAGGTGPAMFDLGRALLECHLDADVAGGWLITPDAGRIRAFLTGYRRHFVPSPSELDALRASTMFGVALMAAVHFRQVLLDGAHGPHLDGRMTRLLNRAQAVGPVADLATAAIGELSG